MGNTNILFAILAALLLGVVFIPWNITLQKINNSQFLIVLGAVFMIAGFLDHFVKGNSLAFTGNSILWAVPTAIIYVSAIMTVNLALNNLQIKLAVIAAIIATYPMITAIFESSLERQMPSFQMIIFMTLTVSGIVGLSLVASKS